MDGERLGAGGQYYFKELFLFKALHVFFFFFEKYEYQENNFFKINLTCAFLAVTSPYSVLFFTFMLFLLSDSKTF